MPAIGECRLVCEHKDMLYRRIVLCVVQDIFNPFKLVVHHIPLQVPTEVLRIVAPPVVRVKRDEPGVPIVKVVNVLLVARCACILWIRETVCRIYKLLGKDRF